MKGLRKRFRRGLAGFLAFVLTMTSFNMVSWADVASAFDKENATFIMNGEDLRDSAQAAIDNGNEFNFEDLVHRRFMEKILMISSVLESEREKMSAKIDLIQKIEKSIYGRIRKERKYERT